MIPVSPMKPLSAGVCTCIATCVHGWFEVNSSYTCLCIGQVQRYTPTGRLYHQAVSMNGKVYMWGGAGNVSPKAIEVFDQCTET